MCEEAGLQPARCIAIGQQADHGIPVFVEYETHVVQAARKESWLHCLYLPYRNLLTCSLYSLIIDSKKQLQYSEFKFKIISHIFGYLKIIIEVGASKIPEKYFSW